MPSEPTEASADPATDGDALGEQDASPGLGDTEQPMREEFEHVVEDEEPDLSIEVGRGHLHVYGLGIEGEADGALIEAMQVARQHMDDQIERSGWNDFLQESYATHDDVALAVGPALAAAQKDDHVLWVFPTMKEVRTIAAPKSTSGDEPKLQFRSIIRLGLRVTNGSSYLESEWIGSAIDGTTSDKHEYQAVSQLQKAALAKTFHLATGDESVDKVRPKGGPEDPRIGEDGGAADEMAVEYAKDMLGDIDEPPEDMPEPDDWTQADADEWLDQLEEIHKGGDA